MDSFFSAGGLLKAALYSIAYAWQVLDKFTPLRQAGKFGQRPVTVSRCLKSENKKGLPPKAGSLEKKKPSSCDSPR